MNHPKVKMTEREFAEMSNAIVNQFGECQCHSHGPTTHLCPGHSFLDEQDRGLGRVERLLWVRRTREQWTAEEHLLKIKRCEICQEVSTHQRGDDRCASCKVAKLLAQPAPVQDERLPW